MGYLFLSTRNFCIEFQKVPLKMNLKNLVLRFSLKIIKNIGFISSVTFLIKILSRKVHFLTIKLSVLNILLI